MTFIPPFGGAFQAPIATPGGAVGWWLSGGIAAANCIAAYQPKGAANLAASYINLANPGTYNAALGVAPAWAAGTGWTFDGLAQYLTTGIIPANGWSLAFRCTGAPVGAAGATTILGMYDTVVPSGAWLCQVFLSGANPTIRTFTVLFPTYSDNSPATAAGVYGVCGLITYLNGVPFANLSPAAGINGGIEIYAGALNLNGAAAQFCGVSLQAVAFWNTTLTPAQILAVSTAMAAL